MTRNDETPPDRLLTVDVAADRLSTSSRFIRRLIAERRIEFVKVGRHVRISESALCDFIAAGPRRADDDCRYSPQDERSGIMPNRGRTPTFQQHQEPGIWPFPDPQSRAGRPYAYRP